MPAHTLAPLPLPRVAGAPSAFSWARLWRTLRRRVTDPGPEVFSLKLDAGQVLRLHEAMGWTLVCRSGTVWVTQETDVRDIFLKRGEGFALDRGGLTLVRACRDAVLSIPTPPPRH